MMNKMVVGFAFFHIDCVCLIRKKRPSWQAGKLNGVGGHIEEGETAKEAMVREFYEEAGVEIPGWTHICIMKGENFHLDVFATQLTEDQWFEVKSNTDEEVEICFIQDLFFENTIPNTKFLVPMCREHLDNPDTFKTAVFEY
jgi:8-oxo-dGTP diphosphatase